MNSAVLSGLLGVWIVLYCVLLQMLRNRNLIIRDLRESHIALFEHNKTLEAQLEAYRMAAAQGKKRPLKAAYDDIEDGDAMREYERLKKRIAKSGKVF